MSGLSTPVAYLIFNRPRHTRESFASIKSQQPSTLFIIADGPRDGHPDDRRRCREVREIVEAIDWPCTVLRNYSDVNLGCKRRVSTGLDWVFDHVEQAIIIEDDCVPSAEFYAFCRALLERYAHQEAVWAVSGNSYQPEHRRGDGSYYFSKYPSSWGWATWRRAWRHYQGDVPFLAEWKQSPRWNACFPTSDERRYWGRVFNLVRQSKIDTWDFAWVACVLYGGGLVATPNANLVKNIGFDAEGTHTTEPDEKGSYDLTPLGEIVHPAHIAADREADEFYFRKSFAGQVSLFKRVVRRLTRTVAVQFARWSARAAA